jgi:hypothetical protein
MPSRCVKRKKSGSMNRGDLTGNRLSAIFNVHLFKKAVPVEMGSAMDSGDPKLGELAACLQRR